MKNIQNWNKKIKDEIVQNSNKRVILLSGASSSGKSYSANELCKYLNQNNIKAFAFSADNYYKGLSRIVVEKTFLTNPQFSKYQDKKTKITKLVRDVIEKYPFVEKFSEQNLQKLKVKLQPVMQNDTDLFVKTINYQYQNINFDEPFALDFQKLVYDINSLIERKNIILPNYSFATSEVTFDKDNILKADYDVYIIEGLYVLRDEILGKLNKNQVVTCSIECDSKTLLSRKLNRDIKSGRSTLSQEQIIISYLSQVIPSYFKYIVPYQKNSKFTLSSSITQSEIEKKETSSQIKFELSKKQLSLLNNLPIKKINNKNQVDYYFQDSSNLKNFVVRLREVDGFAKALTFKNSNKINLDNRKVEEYDLSDFSEQNREITSFVDKFLACGFKLDAVVAKNRKILQFNSTQFKLDKLDNIRYFVEFDQMNDDVKTLINTLNLTKVCNMPYAYLTQIKTAQKTEKEYKFIVNKIPNTKNIQKITQYYFDLSIHKKFVSKMFNSNLSDISSARVRKITNNNKTEYYITLKGVGDFERIELEKKITKPIAVYLLKNNIKSSISKTRYVVNVDDIKFEFDQYNNGLKIAEVEVSNNQTYNQITDCLKNKLNIKFIDVTSNKKYKNEMLAQSIKFDNICQVENMQ